LVQPQNFNVKSVLFKRRQMLNHATLVVQVSTVIVKVYPTILLKHALLDTTANKALQLRSSVRLEPTNRLQTERVQLVSRVQKDFIAKVELPKHLHAKKELFVTLVRKLQSQNYVRLALFAIQDAQTSA